MINRTKDRNGAAVPNFQAVAAHATVEHADILNREADPYALIECAAAAAHKLRLRSGAAHSPKPSTSVVTRAARDSVNAAPICRSKVATKPGLRGCDCLMTAPRWRT